jgi:FkbM family methyltransferase
MNDLLSIKRVSSFEMLLSAYAKANGGLNDFDAIDGGAGMGSTSRQMMKFMREGNSVYAFEPFPGNHRFFKAEENGIRFIPKALADQEKIMTFRVPSVVTEDSVWGGKGMTGYSSVGYLVPNGTATDQDIQVECVCADNVIPAASNIGFVKLDLQGGELSALRGMTRILEAAKLLWVEFTGQTGLLDFLIEHDYIVFDTEYFLMGQPTAESRLIFDISKTDVMLSTNKLAWFGFRKRPWKNFEIEFARAKKEFSMVQTDLVCINKRYFSEFVATFPCL